MDLYTVLMKQGEDWLICFEGRRPILEDIDVAMKLLQDFRDFNSLETYKIAKVEIQ